MSKKTKSGAAVGCMELLGVSELCQQLSIELRGADGQPYCCGERMEVRSGIIGVDYAKCRKCGKAIGNVMSPHINGGYIVNDDFVKQHGDRTWTRLDTPNTKLRHPCE